MKIQEVMTAINQMEADGIIGRYAIGGWPVQFLPPTRPFRRVGKPWGGASLWTDGSLLPL